MQSEFSISGPRVPTLGDYVSFEIRDGSIARQAKISGTALAILEPGSVDKAENIFGRHIEEITAAAQRKSRGRPVDELISLVSTDF